MYWGFFIGVFSILMFPMNKRTKKKINRQIYEINWHNYFDMVHLLFQQHLSNIFYSTLICLQARVPCCCFYAHWSICTPLLNWFENVNYPNSNCKYNEFKSRAFHEHVRASDCQLLWINLSGQLKVASIPTVTNQF